MLNFNCNFSISPFFFSDLDVFVRFICLQGITCYFAHISSFLSFFIHIDAWFSSLSRFSLFVCHLCCLFLCFSVSTLQFKVSASASQSENTLHDLRLYRANTLPPSYAHFNPAQPSSHTSSSSQEREGGYRTVDSPQKKAQQLSQLSTSLASAFSPVQPGVTPPPRNIKQIPLSPPTAHQDPKHATWSSTHMYAPLPTASPPVIMAVPVKQPALPVALPLPPLNNGPNCGPTAPANMSHLEPVTHHQQLSSGPAEEYCPYQNPPMQVSSGAPLHPHYPIYESSCPLPLFIGQPIQGPLLHQRQLYQATPQFNTTPTSHSTLCEGATPKTSPSPVYQNATASSSKYFRPPSAAPSVVYCPPPKDFTHLSSGTGLMTCWSQKLSKENSAVFVLKPYANTGLPGLSVRLLIFVCYTTKSQQLIWTNGSCLTFFVLSSGKMI